MTPNKCKPWEVKLRVLWLLLVIQNAHGNATAMHARRAVNHYAHHQSARPPAHNSTRLFAHRLVTTHTVLLSAHRITVRLASAHRARQSVRRRTTATHRAQLASVFRSVLIQNVNGNANHVMIARHHHAVWSVSNQRIASIKLVVKKCQWSQTARSSAKAWPPSTSRISQVVRMVALSPHRLGMLLPLHPQETPQMLPTKCGVVFPDSRLTTSIRYL